MRLSPLILAAILAGCSGPGSSALPEGERIPTIDTVVVDSAIGENEWAGALRYAGAFVIDEPNAYAGTRAFEVRVAREANPPALVVAVSIDGVDPEPFTRPEGPWYPYKTTIYIADNDQLTTPSDAITISYTPKFNATGLDDGYWDGTMWAVQNDKDYSNESGERRSARSYLHDETLTNELRIPQGSPLVEWDGAQLTAAANLRLNVQFGVLGPGDGPKANETIRGWGFVNMMDNWPGDGHNMWGHVDPRGWLRLRWE